MYEFKYDKYWKNKLWGKCIYLINYCYLNPGRSIGNHKQYNIKSFTSFVTIILLVFHIFVCCTTLIVHWSKSQSFRQSHTYTKGSLLEFDSITLICTCLFPRRPFSIKRNCSDLTPIIQKHDDFKCSQKMRYSYFIFIYFVYKPF